MEINLINIHLMKRKKSKHALIKNSKQNIIPSIKKLHQILSLNEKFENIFLNFQTLSDFKKQFKKYEGKKMKKIF